MRKTAVSALGVLAFILFAASSWAAAYPKPTGFVNDFAALLPADTARKLEAELRNYEKQTSIEIAVVTVPSLGGMEVEEYTIGLAKEWKVGKKQKNNGIVLLVAPNERKTRIEVGYGLEPDLSDAMAGRIIRENMIPRFKSGNMSAGIEAGVAAIIDALGTAPYETRLQERRAAEKKRAEDAAIQAARLKKFFGVAGSVILFGIVLMVIALWISRIRRRHREQEALNRATASLLEQCEKRIAEGEASYPRALQALDALKAGNPDDVWRDLASRAAAAPQELAEMKQALDAAKAEYAGGARQSKSAHDSLLELSERIEGYASLQGAIEKKAAEVQTAKTSGADSIASLPAAIAAAKEQLNHPDVSEKTRKSLEGAQALFSQAKALAGAGLVNWILVAQAAANAEAALSTARKAAESEKAYAAKARAEGPKLLQTIPASIAKAKDAVAHKDVSAETKKVVDRAERKYQEAKKMSGNSPADWLVIFGLLAAAANLVAEAMSKAKADKSRAQQEREDDESSLVTSAVLIGSSLGGSSSGGGGGFDSGGFGGFGGGGFGGGGASGGW